MYADRLRIQNFKGFEDAEIDLNFPRNDHGGASFKNINLILGNNAGGKSSLLSAVALSVLGPVLRESGYVPYYLVRRPDSGTAELSLVGQVHGIDNNEKGGVDLPTELEQHLIIQRSRSGGHLDRMASASSSDAVENLLFDDHSPAFFIVGYGATRRVEGGDYVESSNRKSRGPRYGRVAGLFEDHLPLRPLAAWYRKLPKRRNKEVMALFEHLFPPSIHFTGDTDDEGEYLFEIDLTLVPFRALSDGYKAFIGWTSDLIGHLVDVCPKDMALREVPGIVLVDEIDLHLHPDWQRRVVNQLSTTFPALQFIMSTHSPLIAGSVYKENIFVTLKAVDGSTRISRLEESTYGRSVEQLLLSSYFNLDTTRPDTFEQKTKVLHAQTADGNAQAALEFLRQMSQTTEDAKELTKHFEKLEKDREKWSDSFEHRNDNRKRVFRATLDWFRAFTSTLQWVTASVILAIVIMSIIQDISIKAVMLNFVEWVNTLFSVPKE